MYSDSKQWEEHFYIILKQKCYCLLGMAMAYIHFNQFHNHVTMEEYFKVMSLDFLLCYSITFSLTRKVEVANLIRGSQIRNLILK